MPGLRHLLRCDYFYHKDTSGRLRRYEKYNFVLVSLCHGIPDIANSRWPLKKSKPKRKSPTRKLLLLAIIRRISNKVKMARPCHILLTVVVCNNIFWVGRWARTAATWSSNKERHHDAYQEAALPTLPQRNPLGRYSLAPDVPQELQILPSYDPFWLVVSTKLNLAVTIVPKVMCSSIRGILDGVECHNVTNKRCAEARQNDFWRERSNYPLLKNLTRVLFLRDPIERAMSAYENSLNNPYIETPSCSDAASCTFDEWVEELHRHGLSSFRTKWEEGFNEHFHPQFKIAQFDRMQYHYVLRISSLIDQEFFSKELVGGVTSHPILNKSSKEKGNHTLTPRQKAETTFDSLSNSTLEKLYNMYKEDFCLWSTILKHGTPRSPGEITTFDIYMEKERSLRNSLHNCSLI